MLGRWSSGLSWVGIGLVAVFVEILVFAAIAPSVFGLRFVIVGGGSMEPAIPRGSVAIMADIEPGQVRVGDIVKFEHPGARGRDVTHRVVAISEDRTLLTTQGDANALPDDFDVPIQNVDSRHVLTIPDLGHLLHWMGTRQGYITLILIPGLTVIALEIVNIVRTIVRAGLPGAGTGRARGRAAEGSTQPPATTTS